jgi:hypothetical protein
MWYPTSHESHGHFVVSIGIVSNILNISLYSVHLITNVLHYISPLTLPFITMKRMRLWEMLCLVLNVAIKWWILREVAVLVIDILEVFLIDDVIHNIFSYIKIMLVHIRICSSSIGSFPTHVLTIFAHVLIIPSCVLIIPSCVLTILVYVVIIPSCVLTIRIHVWASWSLCWCCHLLSK